MIVNIEKYEYQVQIMEYRNELYTDDIFVCNPSSIAYSQDVNKFKRSRMDKIIIIIQ